MRLQSTELGQCTLIKDTHNLETSTHKNGEMLKDVRFEMTRTFTSMPCHTKTPWCLPWLENLALRIFLTSETACYSEFSCPNLKPDVTIWAMHNYWVLKPEFIWYYSKFSLESGSYFLPCIIIPCMLLEGYNIILMTCRHHKVFVVKRFTESSWYTVMYITVTLQS